MHISLSASARGARALHAISAADASRWLKHHPHGAHGVAAGFTGAEGTLAALPDGKGNIAAWVLGLGTGRDGFALAAAAAALPAGLYKLADVPLWYAAGAGAPG